MSKRQNTQKEAACKEAKTLVKYGRSFYRTGRSLLKLCCGTVRAQKCSDPDVSTSSSAFVQMWVKWKWINSCLCKHLWIFRNISLYLHKSAYQGYSYIGIVFLEVINPVINLRRNATGRVFGGETVKVRLYFLHHLNARAGVEHLGPGCVGGRRLAFS